MANGRKWWFTGKEQLVPSRQGTLPSQKGIVKLVSPFSSQAAWEQDRSFWSGQKEQCVKLLGAHAMGQEE
jgi:hypothetical protein